jgi:hypothetical protein
VSQKQGPTANTGSGTDSSTLFANHRLRTAQSLSSAAVPDNTGADGMKSQFYSQLLEQKKKQNARKTESDDVTFTNKSILSPIYNVMNYLTGNSHRNEAAPIASQMLVNTNYKSDDTHKVAQQTLSYRKYRTNALTNQSIIDVMEYPVRTYTPQQLQQFTAGMRLHSPLANDTVGMTEYEQALRAKQLAYSSLLPIINTTTTTSSQLGSLSFIDAPIRCLRINSNFLTSNDQSMLYEKPTIAIITSTQSTKNHTNVASSLLYKHLIKTILSTVTASEQYNWNVILYIAIDHTDTWWIQHFQELAPYIPVWLSVNMCVYPKNRAHHIPFNEIAMTAYSESFADYYVRVNDDTEFKTSKWITIGISALQNDYDPPNIGVVGPTCSQGNTAIMTHDMVHRTHIEIFNGYYYPPSFNNWFLDDWISNVYGATTLGSEFHRSKVVTGWTIRHMMYETRYVPDYISAQWLPVEYERGRWLIQNHVYHNYPNHSITQNQMIANALPLPKQYDVTTIEEIIGALPSSKRSNANILIWGLNFDSQYWHRISPNGHVVFLEDKDPTKKYERKGIWRDYILKIFPFLQCLPVGFTTTRDNLLHNYETFVMGQNAYNQYNWCDLQIAKFPEVVLNTTWDIIIVDAPERCSSADLCYDDEGPSALQAMYMTKILVANQLKRQSNGSPIHVYVDDYDRVLEKEFASRLFLNKRIENENVPKRILERHISKGSSKIIQVAHFMFNSTSVDSKERMVVPQCEMPLLRDPDFYPKNGALGTKVVAGIIEVLPKLGNILIWGIGPDCMFWHQSTRGRAVFLVDINKEPLEINTRKVKHVDYFKGLYPELEIYEVTYTSKNSVDFTQQYSRQPNRWPSLTMNQASNRFPEILLKIAWDVIVVDDPSGCCSTSPGRLQSLYMSKILAASSTSLMVQQYGRSVASAATHIFVDDYERALEKDFSNQFYGKVPSKLYRKTKTLYTGQFELKIMDIAKTSQQKNVVIPPKFNTLRSTYHKQRDMLKLEDAYLKYNTLDTIEWKQVCEILKVLPLNGNLMIWGETNNLSFWRAVTSGTIVFLSTNKDTHSAVDNLYTYNVNYTIANSEESYRRYFDRPDLWYNLELKQEFSPIMMQTKWDVIFIDTPQTIDKVGKYQSLYMTKIFAKRSEAIVQANEKAHARDLVTSQRRLDDTVHVFVDDYQNKVEHQYSLQFFGREPFGVYNKSNETLRYAHFAFGRNYNNNDSVLSMNKYLSKVVRSAGAVPQKTQMGWDQIRTILANLPMDGNLLVWGLGYDSPFWSRTTTGRVAFLEDGSFGTNLINGKRWFDLVIEKYPNLEAYPINYTTKNTDEAFNRFMQQNELWRKELNISANIPTSILKTRWDVILVDAPLGFPGSGPGRYQSLYMARLLAEQNEFINSSITHVFVDDYERKVEREFSQRVFERYPIEVIGRKKRIDVPANEQAHFVFGAMPSTQVQYQASGLSPSKLVPWTGPSHNIPNQYWDSFVVLVEVNDGYFNFFLNWLYHYESLNIRIDILVIAEDDIVKGKVERQVVPSRPFVHVERTSKDFVANSLSYGTLNYKKLVSGRATHILSRLKAGQNVIYTDVDTVWRLNPLPYLSALQDRADAVLEVDTEKFEGFSPYYCTGFMAFASNSRTIALITAWENALKTPQLNQPIFNKLLHKRSDVLHQPLPNIEFPSGQMYFNKMNPTQREHAVVVHNNYVQGIQNKQIRFEQRSLWKLEERLTATLPAASGSWFKLF